VASISLFISIAYIQYFQNEKQNVYQNKAAENELQKSEWMGYKTVYAKLINEQSKIKATHKRLIAALLDKPKKPNGQYADDPSLRIGGEDRAILSMLGKVSINGQELPFELIVDLAQKKTNPSGASAKEQIRDLNKLERLVDAAIKKIKALQTANFPSGK
jgi:hypothetical protein